MAQCPFCAEEIKDGVLLCKHCKRVFDEVTARDIRETKLFGNKTSPEKFQLFILLFNITISSWSIAASHIYENLSNETKTLFCLLSIGSGAVLIKLFVDGLPAVIRFCKGLLRFLCWLVAAALLLLVIGKYFSGVAVIGATNIILFFIVWQLKNDQKNL